MDATHLIRRRSAAALRQLLLATAALVIAATCAAPALAAPDERVTGKASASAKAAAKNDPWGWASGAQGWAQRGKVLPAGLVAKGATAPITRGQFVAALLKVEQQRAAAGAGTVQLGNAALAAPALADAPANSPAARAVSLRWLTLQGGRFASAQPITGNEAALAMTGVLGLRGDVQSLAVRLKSEVPGVQAPLTYAAAHALSRTMGLRYNVLDPNDALELGPTDAVNVAHGSYMLQAAVNNTRSWKLDEARKLATTFDLPTLGANQNAVLATAVRQLGQPYVWAGETEGQQAEGHGGFDCSGFTIRVINDSGIAPTAIAPILERTTYTQSAVGARISRDKLQPGDAIFFGNSGPSSAPGSNYHAGVYMGNGWFIHSSGGNGGVAINSLDGWWSSQFSWGRRALLAP